MKRETLRTIRKDRLNLLQRELAEILGYTQRQIAKMEAGQTPIPKSVVFALAWILLYGPKDPYEDE